MPLKEETKVLPLKEKTMCQFHVGLINDGYQEIYTRGKYQKAEKPKRLKNQRNQKSKARKIYRPIINGWKIGNSKREMTRQHRKVKKSEILKEKWHVNTGRSISANCERVKLTLRTANVEDR